MIDPARIPGPNIKGLGWRQRAMLAFMRRNTPPNEERVFSIHKDERPTALSLQRRGLIRVVFDLTTCWQVKEVKA